MCVSVCTHVYMCARQTENICVHMLAFTLITVMFRDRDRTSKYTSVHM